MPAFNRKRHYTDRIFVAVNSYLQKIKSFYCFCDILPIDTADTKLKIKKLEIFFPNILKNQNICVIMYV